MVSVIIPTFNRERTIIRSINSVLMQSCRDFELIVVDDGSTDQTRSLIERVSDSRVRYIYQENAGACAARNMGVSIAKGDYIAFHDSDDLWHPYKLEKQMQVMNETGADIVFCQMLRRNIGEGMKVIPELRESGFIKYHDLMVGISTQTLLMKREVIDHIAFDVNMPRFQDLEWLLRAVKHYSLYGMKEVMVDYYFSDDSISMSDKKMVLGISRICNKNPDLKKDVPAVYRVLKELLLAEGTKLLCEGRQGYADCLQMGFSMSDLWKDKLKHIAICAGVFRPIYKLRHCFDRLGK